MMSQIATGRAPPSTSRPHCKLRGRASAEAWEASSGATVVRCAAHAALRGRCFRPAVAGRHRCSASPAAATGGLPRVDLGALPEGRCGTAAGGTSSSRRAERRRSPLGRAVGPLFGPGLLSFCGDEELPHPASKCHHNRLGTGWSMACWCGTWVKDFYGRAGQRGGRAGLPPLPGLAVTTTSGPLAGRELAARSRRSKTTSVYLGERFATAEQDSGLCRPTAAPAAKSFRGSHRAGGCPKEWLAGARPSGETAARGPARRELHAAPRRVFAGLLQRH